MLERSAAQLAQVQSGLRERFGKDPRFLDFESTPELPIEQISDEHLLRLRGTQAILWLMSKQAYPEEVGTGIRTFFRQLGDQASILHVLRQRGFLGNGNGDWHLTPKAWEYLASRDE